VAHAHESSLRDLVPLYEAAAHALARLLPVHVAASADAIGSLDLVALAIFAMVPVHKRDPSGELRRASTKDLAEVKRARGASVFWITRADAETAAERLAAQYIGTKPCAPAPSSDSKRKNL
jgi:hypothetical protein